MAKHLKNIVVIGGGTGTAMVIRTLKKFPLYITALPAMADDGGSSGILRRELGVLPAGDVRQCIIALAENSVSTERLLGHRFTKGTLAGHNVGNIIFAALEKEGFSFEQALEYVCTLFHVHGAVHPTTLTPITLVAHLENEIVEGQSLVHTKDLTNIQHMSLRPAPRANPKALAAIREADAIVFAPGDWYSSIVPALLVPSIRHAIQKSSARKIHICNLMTTKGHTEGWSVETFRKKLEELLQSPIDDTVYNTRIPKGPSAEPFLGNGRTFVTFDNTKSKLYIPGTLLHSSLVSKRKGDPLLRNPVRHDEHALAILLMRTFHI